MIAGTGFATMGGTAMGSGGASAAGTSATSANAGGSPSLSGVVGRLCIVIGDGGGSTVGCGSAMLGSGCHSYTWPRAVSSAGSTRAPRARAVSNTALGAGRDGRASSSSRSEAAAIVAGVISESALNWLLTRPRARSSWSESRTARFAGSGVSGACACRRRGGEPSVLCIQLALSVFQIA